MQLQPAGAIDEVDERRPAGFTARGDPPRDAVRDGRLLSGGQVRVAGRDRRDRLDTREPVGKRFDALGAQALELGPPRGEQLGKTMIFPAHGGEAT